MHRKREQVNADIEQLDVKIALADEVEHRANSAIMTANATISRIETLEEAARQKLTDAIDTDKKARLLLQEATEVRIDSESIRESSRAFASETERKFKLREETLDKLEKEAYETRKELDTERKQLKDMRVTLETELKRLYRK